MNADLDQQVFGGFLGILDKDVKIPILIEHTRVDQFVLELVSAPTSARIDQVFVWICRLRILVEILHVRMGRRTVEVEVVFLDVLTVIALAVGQAEEPLFEDRVFPIPQRQREAEALLIVGNPRQAVFSPTIRPRPCLIVGEVVPGVAAFAVVLAHRAPLAFAEIRPPPLPRNGLLLSLFEAKVFCCHA